MPAADDDDRDTPMPLDNNDTQTQDETQLLPLAARPISSNDQAQKRKPGLEDATRTAKKMKVSVGLTLDLGD